VENGLVTFLRAQDQTKFQAASAEDYEKAVKLVLAQYKAGTIDFTRVTQLEQALVQAQDLLAQARGEIALGLVQTYRALGGGWELGHQDGSCGAAARSTDAVQVVAPPPAKVEQPTVPKPNPQG